MERKKILYIHQGAGGGGASTSLFLLVNDINDKSDYEPVVLFGMNGPYEESLRAKGVKTYIKKLSVLGVNTHSPKISSIQIIRFLIRFLPNIIMVYKIIKNEKVSLVHINSSVSITSAIASYLAGVKVIWHIREIIPNTKIGRLQKWLIKFIASDIIAISKEVAKHLDTPKTTLIYNGINPEKFKPTLEREVMRKKYQLNKEEKIFTHIGQLFPAKGTFIFLKAAKLLTESGYNVRFFIIGGHPISNLNSSFITKTKKVLKYLLGLRTKTWKEELKNFARDERIAERVIFTGYRDDVANFISLSDAVVVPHCVPEPFGRVLIEAGVLRKPVISSNIPATPEIIIDGETGFLVKPKNPKALAKTMEYIINNPIQAQKMGENGYRNVVNNFHINMTHSKIQKLYEKILMETV